MKYPRMFNTLTYYQEEDYYIVKNEISEGVYEIPSEYMHFLLQLDGKTNPYDIKTDFSIEEALETFDECDLIRYGRGIRDGFVEILFALYLPTQQTSNSPLFKILNYCLMIIWLPLLYISCNYLMDNISFSLKQSNYILELLLAYFISMSVHELGHMIATFAYGGRVMEAGVGLQFFMPVAYVINDCDQCSIKQRIQVYFAGVEMNFLLCGISFILCVQTRTSLWLNIGIINLVLGISNLVLVDILDGFKAFSLLMGYDICLMDKLNIILDDKKTRKTLLNRGIRGCTLVMLAYIIKYFRYAFWIFALLSLIFLFID